MAWHLWGQGSISHHPTLGGTEKMLSWPNLPYAVLDKHSSNVAGYHELAKMRFEYLWLHQKDRRCCWCSICSSIQRAALRTGHAQTQQLFIQFWSYISSVCANKRSMHLSYWCSYGFSGDPSSIKMARVGRGSDEDQQQCPCAEKIKTSVLILQTANQLENSQPQPLISIIPKKINQHSNSSQRNPGFGANLSHFPREVSSNCWEPQVTGWPAASAKCQALPPGC